MAGTGRRAGVEEEAAAAGGLLQPAFILTYSRAGPAAGWLGARRPRMRLAAAGVLVWSVTTVASGLAPTSARLLVARAVIVHSQASLGSELGQERGKILPGAGPLERGHRPLGVVLEAEQAVLNLGQGGEVVGRQNLALGDGDVALDLVELYSASPVAIEEFPDLDVIVRGAISIGRRLQDPLAELVKIDPKSIGVGQYQHDVDQRLLKKKLEESVESCVNHVGVDVNTASRELLGCVAGLTATVARNIVAHRNSHGPFRSRTELMAASGTRRHRVIIR